MATLVGLCWTPPSFVEMPGQHPPKTPPFHLVSGLPPSLRPKQDPSPKKSSWREVQGLHFTDSGESGLGASEGPGEVEDLLSLGLHGSDNPLHHWN